MPRSLTLAKGVLITIVALALLGCAVNEAGVNYGPGILHPTHSYLENRVLDLADIVTINIGPAFGLHAEAHATHAIAVGLGGAWDMNFGSSERPREFGCWNQTKAEATLLCFSWGILKHDHLYGPNGWHEDHFEVNHTGLQTSMDELYQQQRDYWGFGVSATAVFLSAQLEIHPLQIVDFLVGIVDVDQLSPLEDDI